MRIESSGTSSSDASAVTPALSAVTASAATLVPRRRPDGRPWILSRNRRSSSSDTATSSAFARSALELELFLVQGPLEHHAVLTGLLVDDLDAGRGVHRVDQQLADLHAKRRGGGGRRLEGRQ